MGGVAITGFASDGKVTLSRTGDSVTPHTGVDGDVTYTENADKTGTAALTLKSTSSSLSYLRSLADAKTGVNFSVMDMNAADPIKVSCDECRVQKVADAPRTKQRGQRVRYHPHSRTYLPLMGCKWAPRPKSLSEKGYRKYMKRTKTITIRGKEYKLQSVSPRWYNELYDRCNMSGPGPRHSQFH